MADEVEEVKWRRTFAVAALVVALVLLGGGIYFHLQQRTLQDARRQLAVAAAAVDAAALGAPAVVVAGQLRREDYEDTLDDYEEEPEPPSGRPQTPCQPGAGPLADETMSAPLLSEVCLQCICETATECRAAECGPGMSCGLFRISRPYWTDAGRPTVQGAASEGEADENRAYALCVNNPFCSARAVAAVVAKYARDCNRDGVVDCQDHAALHMLGPTGCQRDQLLPIFRIRLLRCLARFAGSTKPKH